MGEDDVLGVGKLRSSYRAPSYTALHAFCALDEALSSESD